MVSNQSSTPLCPIIVSLYHIFSNCELEHESEFMLYAVFLLLTVTIDSDSGLVNVVVVLVGIILNSHLNVSQTAG